MHQPHHLRLFWHSDGKGPRTPVAGIEAVAWSKGDSGGAIFGGECLGISEIDELIDQMIEDLELARQQAHARFRRPAP